jgi:hypothetical protein
MGRYPHLVLHDVRSLLGQSMFKISTRETDEHRAVTKAGPIIAGIKDRIRTARATLKKPVVSSDNQDRCRIAASRNAPERAKHCLTRMLPAPRQFVNRPHGFRGPAPRDANRLSSSVYQTWLSAVSRQYRICLPMWPCLSDLPMSTAPVVEC